MAFQHQMALPSRVLQWRPFLAPFTGVLPLLMHRVEVEVAMCGHGSQLCRRLENMLQPAACAWNPLRLMKYGCPAALDETGTFAILVVFQVACQKALWKA